MQPSENLERRHVKFRTRPSPLPDDLTDPVNPIRFGHFTLQIRYGHGGADQLANRRHLP